MARQSALLGKRRVEFCVGPSRVIPGSDGRANVFGNFLMSCASEPLNVHGPLKEAPVAFFGGTPCSLGWRMEA